MNIFLPYEDEIVESVICLDDLRLNKQILEVYQLYMNAVNEMRGYEIKGYKNHPIYIFYKDNIKFLAYYGWKCCNEYSYRFNRCHKLRTYFVDWMVELFIEYKNKIIPQPDYVPFYMEGSKGQPNYIRTTSNVSALFQQKLINKWNNDNAKGRPPKWTNRQVPEFYKKEMMKSE